MSQAKTGILLANLGTPEAPTPAAVKRYLRQFLSDTRVVDTPRLLWWPLLRGVILPIRSPRVAKLYQSVWMSEGSPLMVYSRQQQKALAARLHGQHGAGLHCLAVNMDDAAAALGGVAADMRAGEPEFVTNEMHEQGAILALSAHCPAIHRQCHFSHLVPPRVSPGHGLYGVSFV